jgi:conjugative transfer signal peptidase TraF
MPASALARLGVTIGIGLAAAFALYCAGLRVNLSPSVPVGLYVARRVDAMNSVRRGSLVAACLPVAVAGWGRARGYLHRGSCADGSAPIGKPVFAIAGDTVAVHSVGLALDGESVSRTEPLLHDSDGRHLPRIGDGQYVVRRGEVWLVSTYSPRSWDSRYFGPIPESTIVALLHPIWVIHATAP